MTWGVGNDARSVESNIISVNGEKVNKRKECEIWPCFWSPSLHIDQEEEVSSSNSNGIPYVSIDEDYKILLPFI